VSYWIRHSLAVLSVGLLFGQHKSDDETKKHPFMGDEMRIDAGRKLYLGSCAGCHGPEGTGGRGPSLVQRVSWHPITDESLFDTIQKGVGSMPGSNLEPDRAWEIAAFVRSLTAPAIEVMAAGDAVAGEKLFWGNAGCGGCHRIGGRGGFNGPDLTAIGRIATMPRLRRSILEPDAEWSEGFEKAVVLLRDGSKLEGFVKDRTNYDLQVQLADGTVRSVPIGRVETLEITRPSVMPKDYKTRLSRDEINNLLAFLRLQAGN
jgi:cytochrome c oxidase cbb3-type subunit III